MHFNWIEKDLLAASPLPRSAEDLETLRQGGIRAIITLTEQPLTIRPDVRISQADFERLDVAPYHIPMWLPITSPLMTSMRLWQIRLIR